MVHREERREVAEVVWEAMEHRQQEVVEQGEGTDRPIPSVGFRM